MFSTSHSIVSYEVRPGHPYMVLTGARTHYLCSRIDTSDSASEDLVPY